MIPKDSRMFTWAELTKAEPQLLALLQEAQGTDNSDPHFCANEVWYQVGGLRDRLCDLVGWGAQNQELRTEQAYDLAYEKSYDALPDCRDCQCL